MPRALKRRESFRLVRPSMGRFSHALHLLAVCAGNILSAHHGDGLSLIISIHHRQLPYVKHGHETQSRMEGVVHRHGRRASHCHVFGEKKAVELSISHGLT